VTALSFIFLPDFTFTLTKNSYPGTVEKVHREKSFCTFCAKPLLLAIKRVLPHELLNLGFGWRSYSFYGYGWERDKV